MMEPQTLWEVFENEPVLLYAGTSGWSGSDTSKSRAVTADANGATSKRQSKVLRLLNDLEFYGVTWKELSERTGEHHGSSSGVLSVLHKEGIIARLTETRNKCKVYVLPEYVDDRDVESHGRTKSCPNCGHEF